MRKPSPMASITPRKPIAGFFLPTDDPRSSRNSQNMQAEHLERDGSLAAAENLRNLLDPDYLMEKELVVIGDPDTVIEKLKRSAVTGVPQYLSRRVHLGDLPEEILRQADPAVRRRGRRAVARLRTFLIAIRLSPAVMPAKAGIQSALDSPARG